MVELDVKITSGDLYDFLLRHSYNSVSGLLGAVIGALGVIVGISRQYWIYLILGVDSVISPMDTLYQEQTAGSKQSGLQGTAALCVG